MGWRPLTYRLATESSRHRVALWGELRRARDLFGAPIAPEAEQRLNHCEHALEDFVERVFEAWER